MARIAVVQKIDNVCINIIVAEMNDPAPDECFFVDVDNMACNIGWIYNPVIGDFTDPDQPPADDGV